MALQDSAVDGESDLTSLGQSVTGQRALDGEGLGVRGQLIEAKRRLELAALDIGEVVPLPIQVEVGALRSSIRRLADSAVAEVALQPKVEVLQKTPSREEPSATKVKPILGAVEAR